MMPETLVARMETISEYQSDRSAQGRLYAWGVAWKVALHHFSGGGMSYQHPVVFALYGNGADTVIAAHSIYFQILGNHGFVGFAIFVALWFSTYRQAGWLRKIASLNPQAKWAADLGGMVQVALVGYAVGGAFLSIAYFDLPFYNLMVMVVLSRIWVQRRGWENDPEEGGPRLSIEPSSKAHRELNSERSTSALNRGNSVFIKQAFSLASPSGNAGRLSVMIFHRVLAAKDPLFPDEPDIQRFGNIGGLD